LISVDYESLPRVQSDEIRMLWVHDYCDGPLSGMLVCNGRMCWYECSDMTAEGGGEAVWRYVIRQLTDAQAAEEERWQALFVEHVGDHFTFHDNGERGTVSPRSEHAKFYGAYSKRAPIDYSDCPIVGWFEM
jgi:hypothetical protein